ncbi:MAG: hypothetical protein KDA88_07750 [Planctomycetaceae bacterium]|nr:hypothetical protein [Planctomycetaceae bacterium]MCB9949542.1 hypothetical protein [Planctomycetaceae bacterium]
MSPKPSRPNLKGKDKLDAGACFIIGGIDGRAGEELLAEFFESEGYRLESGDEGHGRYGKGNPILRLILGAFYPRHAFNVVVDEEDDTTITIEIQRAETGYAGGLIGRSQVISEEKRIMDEFEDFLNE